MASLQDILYLKAQQRAQENEEGYGNAAVLGAGIGGTAGVTVGNLAQRLQEPAEGLNKLKPGRRFAGGLVGLILGGALGAGTKALMAQSNPAGEMLAKLQTQGGLDPADTNKLNQVLADSYNSTLSMG